jgi:hypothetical protein
MSELVVGPNASELIALTKSVNPVEYVDEETGEITEIPQTIPTVETKKKAVATPKKPARVPEDLHEVEVHRMTPEEIKSYIRYMRERVAHLSTQEKALKSLSESSFQQARTAEDNLKRLQLKAGRSLNFLISNIKNLNDACNMLIKEDN